MLIRRLKISHKIFGIIAIGIIISTTFAILSVSIGSRQTNTYSEQVTPLDNLRKIQLYFRELEFRMAGVQAEIVTPTASATHLNYTMRKIETLWEELKDHIPDIEEKGKYEKGYAGFREIAVKLEKAYANEDDIEELYDEWLDYKPLLLKSIDKLSETKKSEVDVSYQKNTKFITTISKVIVTVSILSLIIFITFAILIVRTINKPINTIIEAADQVARGDLTHTIRVNTEDEMGIMAKKLNIMIRHLGDAFSKIVNAVETMISSTERKSSTTHISYQDAPNT